MLSIPGRAALSKVTEPLAKALLKTGLTPDGMTLLGTVATIIAALTLFPTGHLFWGTIAIWAFVMLDMVDGAMARVRGGGTKYGAVLDATCDRIADGAIFGGLAWWAALQAGASEATGDVTKQRILLAMTLVCLVTSQVTSYAKARAEATGLDADGGLIERPERLIIVLAGAGITGIAGEYGIDWLEWSAYVAMAILAVGSTITVVQRVLAVRSSPGARDILPPAPSDLTSSTP